jgi:hypothetical protein
VAGRWDLRDLAAGIGLGLLCVWSFARAEAFTALPAEDAAILMRYAEHVAAGHGIVWNIGGRPVDGATDFLFMLLVAALHALGLAVESAARALDVIGVLGSIVVLYLMGRRKFGLPAWVAAAPPALIAVGPAAVYTALGFGAPFFGFAVLLACAACMQFASQPARRSAVTVGASFLFAGLVRPEGVIVAALLAAATVVARPHAWRLLAAGIVVAFVVPGAMYFAWRWWYFGYPLPNPFYKKGGGHLYPDALRDAVSAEVRWFVPLGVLFLAGAAQQRTRRMTIAMSIPLAGFTSAWVLLSPEMNWFNRFQYPALAMFAVVVVVLVAQLRKLVPASAVRRTGALFAALATVNVVALAAFANGFATSDDPQRQLGLALRPYADDELLLATTEAGLTPLLSQWRAVDLWGLNDQQIAHRGLSTEYLASLRPDVVLLHEYPDPARPSSLPGWDAMTATTHAYMQVAGFTEVARWTPVDDPRAPFVVYVSDATARRGELAAAIHNAFARP